MKKALSRIENARLVCSGEDFFETLIEMISHAKNNIQMQFYIFRPDSKGEIILKLLQAKASEGVKIDLLVDAIGSQYDLKKYEVNGFDIMEFSPMSSDLFKQDKLNWLGRRLHYKAMVVDGRECLVGGINIGEEYIGSNKQKPWLDLALYFRGEISSFLSKILSRNWLQYGPALRKLKHIRTYEWNEKNIGATIRVNDYRRGFREITNSYQWAISQAREEVIIMSAYFFPGRKWKEILKKAIAKGVKVKIILGSHSDLPMYNRATHYLYRSMLSIGCEIYEWEESIVHGKVCCIDRKWMTIGSFNLDVVSIFGNMELNTEVYNLPIAQQTHEKLSEIANDSKKISYSSWKILSPVYFLITLFSYLFVRFTLQMLSDDEIGDLNI